MQRECHHKTEEEVARESLTHHPMYGRTVGRQVRMIGQRHNCTQSAISSLELAPAHLKKDGYIQEQVEKMISERNTTIGIIAPKFRSAAWQLGTLGVVKWIVSPFNQPDWTLEDPLWYLTMANLPKLDVSVLVVQVDWSLVQDMIWSSPSLRVVIAIHPRETHYKQRGWKKARILWIKGKYQLVLQEWRDHSNHMLSHHKHRGRGTNVPFLVNLRTYKGMDWNMFLSLSPVMGKLTDELGKAVTGVGSKNFPNTGERS